MSNTFSMKSYGLGNDLFINLLGVFDGGSAWELANIILDHFQILSEKIFPGESHGNYFSTASIC